MKKTSIACAMTAAMLIASASAHSILLGDIKVTSAIHTPLRAELDLHSMAASNLSVNLTPSDIITSDGLQRVYDDLIPVVEHNGYDGPSVRIDSQAPVSEEHLSFFISAASSTGASKTREYIVALNDTSADGTVEDGGVHLDLLHEVYLREESRTRVDPAILINSGRYSVSYEYADGVVVEIPDDLLSADEMRIATARRAKVLAATSPAKEPANTVVLSEMVDLSSITLVQNAEIPQNGLAITLPAQ